MSASFRTLESGSPWARLLDGLAGEIVLRHVAGLRVLDLGYGSPEVAQWVKDRSGEHLSIVEKGALDAAEGSISLPEYGVGSFDVVYCLRTFPHLGTDTESSERLATELLSEAARITANAGTVLIEIANPRSLRGVAEGIRNPITVVSRRRMIVGDRFGLTRWDSLSRFMDYVPETLEFVRVHGLGIFTPYGAPLSIPFIGPLLHKLEWMARDRPLLRTLGSHLVVELRRRHRSLDGAAGPGK